MKTQVQSLETSSKQVGMEGPACNPARVKRIPELAGQPAYATLQTPGQREMLFQKSRWMAPKADLAAGAPN